MIRIAIIGTGNIAPSHIRGYLQFKDRCKIVALVDIYEGKAHATNAQFGLQADVYNSHEELLKRNDIDLVSICTPPYTHASISIDCMRHGIDVICEKPMAASLAECDEIINVQKQTGCRFSVISQNRFRTPIMNLKKVLDSGIAGKVLYAQVDSLWWRGHSYFDLWWRGTWEKEGGGCTLNHAVHHIDMLNWMKGLPAEVTAVVRNLNHDNAEVEDCSVAISTYADGSMSTLTSSLVHHGEEQQFVFQCEKAKVAAPWSVETYRSRPSGFGEPYEEGKKEIDAFYQTLPNLEFEGHDAQINDVLTAIEADNHSFLVHGDDGRRTLEFITAVYKSGFTKATVSLPLAPDDPFYTVEGIRKNVRKFYEKSMSVENFDQEEIPTGNDYSKYNYKADNDDSGVSL